MLVVLVYKQKLSINFRTKNTILCRKVFNHEILVTRLNDEPSFLLCNSDFLKCVRNLLYEFEYFLCLSHDYFTGSANHSMKISYTFLENPILLMKIPWKSLGVVFIHENISNAWKGSEMPLDFARFFSIS